MNSICRWRRRMIEGSLRRGDWDDARAWISDWEAASLGCCADRCSSHRAYLHALSLKLKIRGREAVIAELAEAEAPVS